MKNLFIVGNSRSGTSMMSRIIGKNSEIYTFRHEIHFFEEQLEPCKENETLQQDKSNELFCWLLCVYREGYLKHGSPKKYRDDAVKVLSNYGTALTAVDVYKIFLQHTADEQKANIICEQTPRYLLFADTIFKFFPDAFVLNMVRDPRDILLSQKNKWRVRYLGAKNVIPFQESVRSWINYHPFTISLLWKRSIETALRHQNNPRFITIRYEDMVANPEDTLKNLCNRVGIEFQSAMLNITVKGSSTTKASSKRDGVVDFRGKWKNGGLSKTEIFICEKILGPYMGKFGYSMSGSKPNIFSIAYLTLLFLFKTPLALLMSRRRTKNMWQSIVRRLGHEN